MIFILKDRLKELRKSLNLTQGEFGEKVGLAQTTVAGYETGIRTPAPVVILSIEKEFGLTPGWLETGSGTMFKPSTREEEIAAFVSKALSTKDNTKELFLWALSQLSDDAWSEIRRIAESLLEQKEKPGQ